MNDFLRPCGLDVLTISQEQDCTMYEQKFAQVCGLLLLPAFAPRPGDWSDAASWAEVIDNSLPGYQVGKYIMGSGEVPAPTKVRDRYGKSDVLLFREYELRLGVKNLSQAQYEALRQLQCDWLGFSFWYETVGGRLFGGEGGIKPADRDVVFLFSDDRERLDIVIRWHADADPERTDITGLPDAVDGVVTLYDVFGPVAGGDTAFGPVAAGDTAFGPVASP